MLHVTRMKGFVQSWGLSATSSPANTGDGLCSQCWQQYCYSEIALSGPAVRLLPMHAHLSWVAYYGKALLGVHTPCHFGKLHLRTTVVMTLKRNGAS